eukprot:1161519-Pelagomonas_calceolata.AAC.1
MPCLPSGVGATTRSQDSTRNSDLIYTACGVHHVYGVQTDAFEADTLHPASVDPDLASHMLFCKCLQQPALLLAACFRRHLGLHWSERVHHFKRVVTQSIRQILAATHKDSHARLSIKQHHRVHAGQIHPIVCPQRCFHVQLRLGTGRGSGRFWEPVAQDRSTRSTQYSCLHPVLKEQIYRLMEQADGVEKLELIMEAKGCSMRI